MEQLDAELAVRARSSAAWRLRMGQVLEVLAQWELFFQLGFSSLAAYALERCERSARWVEAARLAARRLEGLPVLRRAVATGQLSWSVAELVSSVACSRDEAHWLALAQRHTVRELRQRVQAARHRASLESASTALETPFEEEAVCTLTCTVDTEDAWLFEATQTLLDHLGTRGHAGQIEALLAEGQEVLLSALPRVAWTAALESKGTAARRQAIEQLERQQTEAEARCSPQLQSSLASPVLPRLNEVSVAAVAGISSLERRSALELDAELRALARAMARQELEWAQLLLQFRRGDARSSESGNERRSSWRLLGYASEAHHARERLGLSRSSLLSRCALARRLEELPRMAEALGAAQIGVEAAQQLVRIATPRTERAWLERARRRTIKHLREEVAAALIAVRASGEVDCPPPTDAELEAYAELQRAVISGRVIGGGVGELAPSCSARERATRPLVPPESQARSAWLITLASLQNWLAGGLMGDLQRPMEQPRARGEPHIDGIVQTSASVRVPGSGRVVLRWRVPRDVYDWWHALKQQACRWLKPGVSWLRFVCLAFWQAWRHVLGAPVEYGGIYLRDGYRCLSPVCSRRDVTPHHLRFRSRGGGDEPANVASVCSWCHLFGIHGGRIRAEGTADCIRWELGPVSRPCVVVHGRERVAA